MDDYIAYVLSQILDEIEGASSPKTQEVFSKKEQGDVEEHLRFFGLHVTAINCRCKSEALMSEY